MKRSQAPAMWRSKTWRRWIEGQRRQQERNLVWFWHCIEQLKGTEGPNNYLNREKNLNGTQIPRHSSVEARQAWKSRIGFNEHNHLHQQIYMAPPSRSIRPPVLSWAYTEAREKEGKRIIKYYREILPAQILRNPQRGSQCSLGTPSWDVVAAGKGISAPRHVSHGESRPRVSWSRRANADRREEACNTLVLHCNVLLKHFVSIWFMCICVW